MSPEEKERRGRRMRVTSKMRRHGKMQEDESCNSCNRLLQQPRNEEEGG
jgi:hypothetical protein